MFYYHRNDKRDIKKKLQVPDSTEGMKQDGWDEAKSKAIRH